MNKNSFNDMRDILICYAESVDDENNPNVLAFSVKVQTLMGVSANRKIQALCYLFDNLLTTNAQLTDKIQQLQYEADDAVHYPPDPVTKEDAYTALQMAITFQAANYQNGNKDNA